LSTPDPGTDYIMGNKQAQMHRRAPVSSPRLAFAEQDMLLRNDRCRKFRHDGVSRMCVNGAPCDLPHLVVLHWLATQSIMLHELVHLLEIRRDIQAKAKVLAAVAESDARLAHRCAQLARQCDQLDGAIEAFMASALQTQVPQGSA
jgi:hypothetical protein